ncbi:MAG: HWE histidine kinase domain-containing protein [Pseudomonadota bacterium]
MLSEVVAFPRGARGTRPDDLSDIELLHRISTALIGEHDTDLLYGRIVDAAVAITGSQFGTMQRLTSEDDPSGRVGELQLLAHRGLPPEAVGFWAWVKPSAVSSCTEALGLGDRAVIPDFEAWDRIAGTEDLEAFRRTGIRSAQTTPLRSRNGVLLGMISTHWSHAHTPSDRDLRLLDIVARQAADLLERTIAEEALRRSEEQSRLLAREAEHRTKNLLSTVLATVHLSSAETPQDLKEVIAGRIQALADVNALFIESRWAGADARLIVTQELAPYGDADGGRVTQTGDAVMLTPDAAQALAVALHELATNAVKYGAFSTETGRIAVDWAMTDERRLRVSWTETGGPATRPPTRRGFGTRVMQGIIATRGGTLDFKWRPEGLRCDFLLPI